MYVVTATDKMGCVYTDFSATLLFRADTNMPIFNDGTIITLDLYIHSTKLFVFNYEMQHQPVSIKLSLLSFKPVW